MIFFLTGFLLGALVTLIAVGAYLISVSDGVKAPGGGGA